MRNVEHYIARRYLVAKRSARFINVIARISIVGIAVGTAALVIALSVFNGFRGVVTSVLIGFDPHLRIEKRGSMTDDELHSIENILKHNQHIKAYSPFISGKAMLIARSFNRVVYVRGVDEQEIGHVSGLKEKIVLGNLSLADSTATGGIVIGLTLADRLGSVVDDDVMIISPSGFQSALSGSITPQTEKFHITGIYESNNKEYDANYAYISLGAAQRLFNLDGKYSGVEMRLTDVNLSEDVKREIGEQLSGDYIVSSWYDLHKNLYSVMKIERWSAYVLLCLIILVATFNMLGSLTMGVIEKRRDIGVLKALGMTSRSITRIFMFEGMLIGAIGTFIGIVLGLLVLYLQVQFQLFPLDPTVYIIPAIPVKVEWTDFLSIVGASMGLSYIASYYPARRAADTLPAESLRWE